MSDSCKDTAVDVRVMLPGLEACCVDPGAAWSAWTFVDASSVVQEGDDAEEGASLESADRDV